MNNKSHPLFSYLKEPHGALNGKTPSQIDSEVWSKTPLQEEVCASYDETKGTFKTRFTIMS